eukprot:XP_014787942.1 PREDICTED: uncharacterized protein LOC106881927 [Octopus bimaculoides]
MNSKEGFYSNFVLFAVQFVNHGCPTIKTRCFILDLSQVWSFDHIPTSQFPATTSTPPIYCLLQFRCQCQHPHQSTQQQPRFRLNTVCVDCFHRENNSQDNLRESSVPSNRLSIEASTSLTTCDTTALLFGHNLLHTNILPTV